MKILHTADWHLGNNFHRHERNLEHQHFLNWLLNTLRAEQPDALIVSGDIFDSANPSVAAEGLFYDFLLQATEAVKGLQIVAIAGNHDSAGRLDAPARLLKRHNIYVRGNIRRNEETGTPDFDHLILPLGERLKEEAGVVCLALPYLRPYDYPAGMSPAEGLHYYFEEMMKRLARSDFRNLPVIAAAHFYAAGAEICADEHSERLVVGGQDCVSADVVGKGICYTALGHIHRCQPIQGGNSVMHYAGSALPMSFSERGYRHGVLRVEIDADGAVSVTQLPYSPLRQLLSIPAQGAASKEEVFAAIEQLPQRKAGDTGDNWPYLEIRLLETMPEPEMLYQVTQALADRAVHFCRMLRVRPEIATAEQSASAEGEQLQSLAPIDMARRVFSAHYGQEMPEALTRRFETAEQICLQPSSHP